MLLKQEDGEQSALAELRVPEKEEECRCQREAAHAECQNSGLECLLSPALVSLLFLSLLRPTASAQRVCRTSTEAVNN